MKLTIREIRRIVFEAVAQAKGAKKWAEDEFKGVPPKDRWGGMVHDKRHDLSVPPSGGSRLKRQGSVSSSPFLTNEEKVAYVVREAVRDALYGKRR